MNSKNKQIDIETETIDNDPLKILQIAHREEIERLLLESAEKIRQIEMRRLNDESKLEKLEEEYAEFTERYRDDIKKFSTQLFSVNDKLQETNTAKALLEERLANAQTQRSALDTERRRLLEDLRRQEEELKESRNSLKVLAGNYRQKEDESEKLSEELSVSITELQEMNTAKALLEERLANAQTQRSALDTERRRLLEDLRRQEEELKESRNSLKILAGNYRQKEDESEKLSEELSVSITELQEMNAAKALVEERLAKAQTQRDALDTERRRLIEDLRKQEEELKESRNSLKALAGNYRQKEDESEKLSEELSVSITELQETNAAKALVEERLANAQTQRDALDTERCRLTEDLRRQEDELKRSQDVIAVLEKKLLESRNDMEGMTKLQEEETERYASSLSGLSTQVSALQQELVRYRSALIDAERRVEAAKKTLSFRLGYALIHGFKNWQDFKNLPSRLFEIHRDARMKRKGTFRLDGSKHESKARSMLLVEMEDIFSSQGFNAAEVFAREHLSKANDLAQALTKLARIVFISNSKEALRIAREAVSLDPRPFRRKWLAFLLFDSGYIIEAHELLLSLPSDIQYKPSERYKANYIAGCYRLLTGILEVPHAPDKPTYQVNSKRVLYVAASSLPYHITGYTSRTHGVVKAIGEHGWEVLCVTRPGYPADRPDSHETATTAMHEIDGVQYQVLEGLNRRKTSLDDYILKSADTIVKKAEEERAAIIHAASNYEVALPALIAARRLGIPFVYEVRGLWEYTSASKIEGWEETERFALDKRLETLCVTNADRVLTLTNALANELQSRGATSDRVALVPNAIDPHAFKAVDYDLRLAESLNVEDASFVIGYIGSVVAYEGLDDLMTAFAQLQKLFTGIKLLIVGDGEALPALRNQAEALGLDNHVVFTGKVQPEVIPRYFALLDAVALPRKPFRVCQLVSPLKPFEAMAMGVPLVVSDVAALKEMVIENETALVHKAGDAVSLTECLTRFIKDTDLAVEIARKAQKEVLEKHTWHQVSETIDRAYSVLLKVDSSKEKAVQTDIDPVLLPPGKNSMTKEEKVLLDKKLAAAFDLGGTAAVQRFLTKQTEARSNKFAAFCEIKAANVLLAQGEVQQALAMADNAMLNDPSASTVRGAARISYNAVELEKASGLVSHLENLLGDLSENDRKFISEVRGRARLADWALQPAEPRSIPIKERRVLNILAFSLPYTSVGYATRSHGLAKGVKNGGWDIRPYTRPGFPYDFKPELEGEILPEQDEIDGVVYHRVFDDARNGMNEVEYLFSSIQHWERIIDKEMPQVVHAASNYVTALPALIAARRKGVPFVYEVRGFWEITRSSRDDGFSNTPKYRLMNLFEGLVSRQADHVITITTAMKEELMNRGVAEEKITVAFNSVDPARFVPRQRNHELGVKLGIPDNVPVIGYIGSFVDYEGLDDLVTASAGLKNEGIDFRLLMVGDGAAYHALQQQVFDLGLEDRVLLTGRVPHDEVEEYYSLVDIAPFPRKPWEVCELVSPLKPFEAMALQKAVVVSSTRALTEIVQDGYNGLVFEKGNIKSLCLVLQKLIASTELRELLGSNAREWIVSERSWDVAGNICISSYKNIRNVE